jgi:hypothetical protein
MRIFRSSAGSATVEASLVFPLIILTVIGMLSIGVRMFERVREVSRQNRLYAEEIIIPVFPAETALRLKWLGINIIGKTGE